MTFVPLCTVCTRAVAAEPLTLIVLIVRLKSSTVLSWASMIVAHLPILLSRARSGAAKTLVQMSAPLAELESLASVLSVAAISAC